MQLCVQGEIALLRSLSHTNIVAYIESYRHADFLYIVLELRPNRAGWRGKSLAGRTARKPQNRLEYS